jgi:hypothetical protein
MPNIFKKIINLILEIFKKKWANQIKNQSISESLKFLFSNCLIGYNPMCSSILEEHLDSAKNNSN